jgi:asparagine synthetase B (glutamine-hydrolysing)
LTHALESAWFGNSTFEPIKCSPGFEPLPSHGASCGHYIQAICDQCETIEEFPAGHYWTPEAGFVKYYNPDWDADDYVGTKDTSHIREVLTQAVKDQMMSDVPIGLLLSGGLDSAVISSIIKPMLEETKQEYITFTIGQEGSPDVMVGLYALHAAGP